MCALRAAQHPLLFEQAGRFNTGQFLREVEVKIAAVCHVTRPLIGVRRPIGGQSIPRCSVVLLFVQYIEHISV
jgi:hypothetical protein